VSPARRAYVSKAIRALRAGQADAASKWIGMAECRTSNPETSVHRSADLLDQLADLRRRRAARTIDDSGYRDELHLMLGLHRLAVSA
jgi:glycerol dehydrogenase-like iron-containing ADH family enzyme